MIVCDGELRERLRRRTAASFEPRHHRLDGRRHAAVSVIVLDSDAQLHGVDGVEVTSRTSAHESARRCPTSVQPEPAARSTARPAARPSSGRERSGWRTPWPVGVPWQPRRRGRQQAISARSRRVGLCDLDLLGRLDDYPTRSGYVITPFVFQAGAEAEPTPAPMRWRRFISCDHRAAEPNSPRFVDIPESDRPVIQVPVGEDLVAFAGR